MVAVVEAFPEFEFCMIWVWVSFYVVLLGV
jgi:hypothetical protein